jgi:hypothetical protein
MSPSIGTLTCEHVTVNGVRAREHPARARNRWRHAIFRSERRCEGQPPAAERLPGRRAAEDRGWLQWARHRQLLERANLELADITLAAFNGTNYLKRIDGGAFEVTDGSGPAIYGASARFSGASLEGSNTDIADEFTKLIVTQQAYSANTRVISTSNQMVQDLLNMLR